MFGFPESLQADPHNCGSRKTIQQFKENGDFSPLMVSGIETSFLNSVIMSSKSTLLDVAKADISNDKNATIWMRQMDALLHFDRLIYMIESDLISKPADDAHQEDHKVYEQWVFVNKSARHLLVGFIYSDLVKQFEHF